mmetsp:Transcript_7798/g.11774  ORF Transcript_7798/g.11774 Transcript_7798/m.11774 type:complete len:201 (-) Transcript_7798:6-608(-)
MLTGFTVFVVLVVLVVWVVSVEVEGKNFSSEAPSSWPLLNEVLLGVVALNVRAGMPAKPRKGCSCGNGCIFNWGSPAGWGFSYGFTRLKSVSPDVMELVFWYSEKSSSEGRATLAALADEVAWPMPSRGWEKGMSTYGLEEELAALLPGNCCPSVVPAAASFCCHISFKRSTFCWIMSSASPVLWSIVRMFSIVSSITRL